LDATVGEDTSTKRSDLIQNSTREGAADHEMTVNDLNKSITRVLNKLGHRERYVIQSYYGVLGHKQKSLEEIGIELDLTRERVRQIKAKAEKRMRVMSSKRILREYV
jgi:RNA polymerase primary sigma factor